MHPSIAHFLPLFRYDHLPPHLQAISKPFGLLADLLTKTIEGPEATVALRKLLEAKDAAVRSVVLGHVVVSEAGSFPGGRAGE